MGRKRDYSKYKIEVLASEKKIKITPRYASKAATPLFGLGNATIRLNLDHLPEKIVKPITGESNGSGLIPPDGKKVASWNVFLGSVHTETKNIEDSYGSEKSITYPVSDETKSFWEKSDSEIKKNGVGFFTFQDQDRLNW